MREIVRLENLDEIYQAENGEITALEGISFSVYEGELLGIVGPSGCGKSTLLSIVSGLVQPTHGTVWIGGEPVNGVSDKIGYMLQKDSLLEWRSIYRNVLLGLEIRGLVCEETVRYVDHLLTTYGLHDFRDKYPSQLSGGMRQRAALIRTLAVRPDLLLLDEAFSALDYQTRLAVTEDVCRILQQERVTTLMVTHDISEAISMCDRVVVLSARPGRIRQIHTLRFPTGDGQPLSPLERRSHENFKTYFNTIWKELDVHVEDQ